MRLRNTICGLGFLALSSFAFAHTPQSAKLILIRNADVSPNTMLTIPLNKLSLDRDYDVSCMVTANTPSKYKKPVIGRLEAVVPPAGKVQYLYLGNQQFEPPVAKAEIPHTPAYANAEAIGLSIASKNGNYIIFKNYDKKYKLHIDFCQAVAS